MYRKLILAGLVLLLLAPACSEAPDFLSEAFPGASSYKVLAGNHPQGIEEVWYATGSDAQIIGYCALAEATGYNGPIRVVTAWTPGQGITFLKVIEHSETDNYGGQHLHSLWFTQQYVGNPSLHEYTLVKMERKNPQEVAIITGATISSEAVTQAVNICLELYRNLPAKED